MTASPSRPASSFRSAPSFRPAPSSRSVSSFRPDVEGLRGLAVLLVVLGHAGGVDVLLAVSGYLVTRSLLAEVDRTGGVSLVRCYGRQVRRALPAAVVVLLAVVTAGRVLPI